MQSVINLFVFLCLTLSTVGLALNKDEQVSSGKFPSSRGLVTCLSWYALQGNPNLILAQTLKPPCTIPTAFPSTLPGGWSVDPECDAAKQPNTCQYHVGAHSCYRHAYRASGPGAQACYKSNGQWISDPWLGAGTVDKETPLGDLIQQGKHVVVDVLPYGDCCKSLGVPQPATCNLYYAKRPPGQCQP
jgi:hypothetical protein